MRNDVIPLKRVDAMLQGDLKKTTELVVEERGFHGKMMENGIFTYMDSVDFCGHQEK